MSTTKQTKTTPIHWNGWLNGNEYLTPAEFLVRINDLISQPLDNIAEMDGDMYMSDYRKLTDAKWHLYHAMKDLEQKSVI